MDWILGTSQRSSDMTASILKSSSMARGTAPSLPISYPNLRYLVDVDATMMICMAP